MRVAPAREEVIRGEVRPKGYLGGRYDAGGRVEFALRCDQRVIDPRARGVTTLATQDSATPASDTAVMDLRVDIVTLGVPDLAAAHEFYVDRLGWEPALSIPGEVTFLRAGSGRMVALFARSDLEGDIGDGGVTPPFDLGMLFESPADVDAAVDAIAAAGAAVRKPPQDADWGGYHAYVEAPDGTLWELAHNPGWRIDSDGIAHIDPVDSP